jgi:hypothetical protein
MVLKACTAQCRTKLQDHGDRAWAFPRVCPQEDNELVRVVVTRIEQDGTMLRRMVDTARCHGGRQWEDLTVRALAAPPPYRPVPGAPIYHVNVGDGTEVMVAEPDLCGPLLDLITAVLAIGDAM